MTPSPRPKLRGLSRHLLATALLLAPAVLAAADLSPLGPTAAAWTLAPWLDEEGGGGGHGADYRDGQHALDAGNWKQAATSFARVAAAKGTDADAALYWQAYALAKDGRQGESLAALRELRASYPKSSWLDDAQVLELEMRGPQAAPPAGSGDNEELKLYALNGLMQVDSQRAVPVLERFLDGNSSLPLKKQALFVLSQSDSAQARQLLAEVATGKRQPALQREAIHMLGVGGGRGSIITLTSLYQQSQDANVKRAVLEAFLVAGADQQVLAIAREEKDSDLRRRAIQQLGAMDATGELHALYASETAGELRRTILQAMGVAGDVAGLAQAARSERDPEVRRAAIQGLGVAGRPSIPTLADLYHQSQDVDVKRAVLGAFLVADADQEVVAIAREEKDPDLRRRAIQQLGAMNATRELHDLYHSETAGEVRRTILQAMGVAGDVEGLSAAARGERDLELRRAAIQSLGVAGGGPALSQIYTANGDAATRRAVIAALFVCGDAHDLIALFRSEKDPELKRDIVQKLSQMDSPEANELLLEMLEQ